MGSRVPKCPLCGGKCLKNPGTILLDGHDCVVCQSPGCLYVAHMEVHRALAAKVKGGKVVAGGYWCDSKPGDLGNLLLVTLCARRGQCVKSLWKQCNKFCRRVLIVEADHGA